MCWVKCAGKQSVPKKQCVPEGKVFISHKNLYSQELKYQPASKLRVLKSLQLFLLRLHIEVLQIQSLKQDRFWIPMKSRLHWAQKLHWFQTCNHCRYHISANSLWGNNFWRNYIFFFEFVRCKKFQIVVIMIFICPIPRNCGRFLHDVLRNGRFSKNGQFRGISKRNRQLQNCHF